MIIYWNAINHKYVYLKVTVKVNLKFLVREHRYLHNLFVLKEKKKSLNQM
jgi:hypothetical protein